MCIVGGYLDFYKTTKSMKDVWTCVCTHELGNVCLPVHSIKTSQSKLGSCMLTRNVLFFFLSLLLEILQFSHGVRRRYCYPWDLGQTAWGGTGKRGVSTVQQKFSVVNDAGTWVLRDKKRKVNKHQMTYLIT